MAKTKNLHIVEASEHNLKKLSVDIPHQSLTVVTGVSGSGKSTLAHQVIFKESQRRFMETFSSYSRQYLGKLEKPQVKEIKGLQAALAINQKSAVANPRSTVGTMSGIYDYLRLLYARTGDVYCAHCGHEIEDSGQDSCGHCQHPQPKILARLFSFNSTYGACPDCKGLGIQEHIDEQKLIADATKSLREGALVPTTPTGYIVYSQVRVDELDKVCKAHDFSVDIPWKDLSPEQQHVIMYGSDRVRILFGKHSLESRLKWKGITAKPREEAYYKGMIPIMEEILKRDRNDNILRFASSLCCHSCGGSRLRQEALAITIEGQTIADLSKLSLSNLEKKLQKITQRKANQDIQEHILNHVFKRLTYLQLLGLNYLSLDRASTTLSGGEAQRIRLAGQLGSGLQGILYILDEPSIGLHARDNQKLIKVLHRLRDNGNTVLVVEHDEETIAAADYLIDIGPKAGIHGGDLMYQGPGDQLLSHPEQYPNSLTATYLGRHLKQDTGIKLTGTRPLIQIKKAKANNLKNIDVDFQMGALNVVTGVSGAGKSTLIHQVLAASLRNPDNPQGCKSIHLDKAISHIIEIDQSPIGRTPRSNPATYTDLLDLIRNLFGKLQASKDRNYKKGRFSFNNKGGRCESCQGAGLIPLGMHFLGDVEITCELCHGKRFNDETLEICYRGKNIHEVLELSIEEARLFFEGESNICHILDLLIQLDVGYLKLGQASTTLSGGEAQRIKLVSELKKTSRGHTVYILDEPTVGLHKADISYLMDALEDIISNNNTVVVIEHDLDVISQASHIIDLGPEGGDEGGQLVCQGSLDMINSHEHSHTASALRASGHYAEKKTKEEVRSPARHIHFSGVNTNNLKNIEVSIPLHQLTVISGVSGSGKSSLAFDTIFSESRNRFTESFSSYARRMMRKLKKPELEHCSGLSPAIAIRQSGFTKNPRSTVGTATEIFDLLRLLFSRNARTAAGKPTQLSASEFSFNNADVACRHCKGMGVVTTTDSKLLISHPQKPLIEGAMDGSLPGKFFGDPHGQFVHILKQVGWEEDIDYSLPFNELSDRGKEIALFGTGDRIFEVVWTFKRGKRSGEHNLKTSWKGFIDLINEEYEIKRGGKRGEAYAPLMQEINCPSCAGKRYQPHVLQQFFDGKDISQMASLSIHEASLYFRDLLHKSQESVKQIHQIGIQLLEKLQILKDLGIGYLSIDRPTASLSGGESQRLRIASQLHADLCGLTYVLDEPSTGLHPRDTHQLMKALTTLKDRGNTILMVEHDPAIIQQADHIIELGPGAGKHGGEILCAGTLEELLQKEESPTAKYLKKGTRQRVNQYRETNSQLSIDGASAHNLKGITLDIPASGLTAVTGISGCGKTSLVYQTIASSFNAGHAINCRHISFGDLKQLVLIDQQKIGTSPLSTAATYTGLFDLIRDIFAKQTQAKANGLKKSHFSFNSKDGGCPECKGMGKIRVSMDFLSDLWVDCDSCHGQRYKAPILEIIYEGHSISDILMLEVDEALLLFRHEKKVSSILQLLSDIGLGYLSLGQATNSLSGGETQRLKLASQLMGSGEEKTLFIFDEPSTGLHMKDVEVLLKVFDKLTASGHMCMVVEHNLDIIQASDWIIDLGPEGGELGGSLLYSGPQKGLIHQEESYTAQALKELC